MADKLVKVTEVARLFDVTTMAVRNWEKSGTLVPYKRDKAGARYYRESDVKALYEERALLKGEIEIPDDDSEIPDDGESEPADQPGKKKIPNLPGGRGGKRPGAGRKAGTEDGSGPYEVLAKARAKNETYRAKLSEIEYQKKVGKLLDADEVAAVWRTQVQTVKERLLSIPARIAPALLRANELRDIENALRDALNTVLEELSSADASAD